jgi:hypothetical protein
MLLVGYDPLRGVYLLANIKTIVENSRQSDQIKII